MGKLTIEQKAQRYDEAIKVAKDIRNGKATYIPDGTPVIEAIFPELKESENEKIREEIISYIKANVRSDELCESWIAWLEKQGEQKPIINVPPREVILSIWDLGNEWKELTNGCISTEYGTQLDYIQKHWHESEYYLKEKQGKLVKINPTEFDTRLQALIGKFGSLPKEELIGSLSFYLNVVQNDGTYKPDEKQGEQKPADKVEPKFHEGEWITNGDYTWQIVEVKPLDYILQSQDGNIVDDTISHVDEQFHSFTIEDVKEGDVLADGNLPFLFKKIDANKHSYAYCGISVDDGFKIESDGEHSEWTWMQDIKLATKEQRDLLFAKMKEAGYEWDADKKKLKKIEQKSAEWSEKDETYSDHVITAIKSYYTDYKGKENPWREELLMWLKSLKDKVQQRQEWSEEDVKVIKEIIFLLKHYNSNETLTTVHSIEDMIIWLKSLRPQNTWNMSDEQMEALREAVDAEIVEVEDNDNSMCAHTHLEICTDEDLSKICKAGDKAKVIIIK